MEFENYWSTYIFLLFFYFLTKEIEFTYLNSLSFYIQHIFIFWMCKSAEWHCTNDKCTMNWSILHFLGWKQTGFIWPPHSVKFMRRLSRQGLWSFFSSVQFSIHSWQVLFLLIWQSFQAWFQTLGKPYTFPHISPTTVIHVVWTWRQYLICCKWIVNNFKMKSSSHDQK